MHDMGNLPFELVVQLTDREYEKFARLIYEKCGIDLGNNKKDLVKARLMKRLRALSLRTFDEYYEYVANDQSSEELVAMIDAVSTNVTSFFREKEHFAFMHKTALADIIAHRRKLGQSKLRIWSAACSTGEEIYTILMTVCEYPESWGGWDIKALGTDISTKALRVAKAGCYAQDRLKDVPALLIDRYFTKQVQADTVSFCAKNVLRSMAYFSRLNLISETFPFHSKFDIIFCRNVMIYFDKPTQERLVNKLASYLEPWGYLFIGHSESLIGLNVRLKNMAPATFRKS